LGALIGDVSVVDAVHSTYYEEGVRDYYRLCFRARPYVDEGEEKKAAEWERGFRDAQKHYHGRLVDVGRCMVPVPNGRRAQRQVQGPKIPAQFHGTWCGSMKGDSYYRPRHGDDCPTENMMDNVTGDGYRTEEVKCEPTNVDVNPSDRRRIVMKLHCTLGSDSWDRTVTWRFDGKKLWVKETD
jgi:hypothetical protein